MVALAREVCALREKQRLLLEKIAKLEHVAALCARERDAFELEVSRLRGPMLSDATGRVESMLQELEWTGAPAGNLKAMRMRGKATRPQALTVGRKALASAAFTGAYAISRPRISAAESCLQEAAENPRGTSFDADAQADTPSTPFIGATLLTSTSGHAIKGHKIQSQSMVLAGKKAALLELSGMGLGSGSESGQAWVNDSQAQKRIFLQDDLQRYLCLTKDGARNSSLDKSDGDGHDVHNGSARDFKWATSPSSTPHRLELTKSAATFSNRGQSHPQEPVQPVSNANKIIAVVEMGSIPAGRVARAGAPASLGPGLMMRSRSRFVGSGLGLRNDPAEADRFNPAGSAKTVLKKILSDFDG
jgi:hypothetical protein